MEEKSLSKENQQTRAFKIEGATDMTTFGSYCHWNRDVNLAPPHFVKELPKDDQGNVYSHYDGLQCSLYETNYLETEDRTMNPITSLPDTGISIVILASPVECLDILLEGGRIMDNNIAQ
jgi:hypothetical protein